METLKITTKQEAEQLARELKKKPQVKAVELRSSQPEPDPVALASEASLAESWDSPEDARWDELLR